ncbi:GNAT family N-acetyltransferase [Longilinea arvoryzae]|nr:GNAT family N-acetyltransferase [Longilinea arvoryzae]
MITYRPAQTAEFPELAELRWQFRVEHDASQPGFDASDAAHAEFIPVCLEFLQQGLTEGRWTYWVAVQDDGLIVSNAYVYRIPKVPRPGLLRGQIGYVTNVYTRPTWRGQGIGAQLLRAMQAWARDNAVERLILWPAEGRQDFYGRLGFLPGETLEWDG